jgi:hypothetical protein
MAPTWYFFATGSEPSKVLPALLAMYSVQMMGRCSGWSSRILASNASGQL